MERLKQEKKRSGGGRRRRVLFADSASWREWFELQSGEGSVQPWTVHDGTKPLGPIHQNPPTSLHLSDATTSLLVRISQPSSSSLHLLVFGSPSLCEEDQQALLAQVSRMLHLLQSDERNVREFHKIHPGAKESGFGRVFRSPTLFEDMV